MARLTLACASREPPSIGAFAACARIAPALASSSRPLPPFASAALLPQWKLRGRLLPACRSMRTSRCHRPPLASTLGSLSALAARCSGCSSRRCSTASACWTPPSRCCLCELAVTCWSRGACRWCTACCRCFGPRTRLWRWHGVSAAAMMLGQPRAYLRWQRVWHCPAALARRRRLGWSLGSHRSLRCCSATAVTVTLMFTMMPLQRR